MNKLVPDENIILTTINEQKRLLHDNELTSCLRAGELLLGAVALKCVISPSLYRGFPTKIIDNPKTDSLSILVEQQTLEEYVEAYAHESMLSAHDITRLLIGTGFARLLVLHSLKPPTRVAMMRRFLEALSEPQQFYNRTMESRIFDNAMADETARRIVIDGHDITVSVNAGRLMTGMFIEVQPDASKLRTKIESTFQEELQEAFDGKQIYLRTIDPFIKDTNMAENMYVDTVTQLMGLSFPMATDELQPLVKLLP